MEKQQSNNFHWLEILEAVSVIGSIGGSVASLIFQQVFFASLPLSLSVTLNLVNRRRLLNLAAQDNQTVLTQLSQQSQEYQTNIRNLSEQLTGIQHSSIAQLLQRSQEHQLNIKALSEQLTKVQQLTTDLSSRNQYLHEYVYQEAKEKPVEEKPIEEFNSAEFYYKRGLSFQDAGNKQRAIEDYSEAIRLDTYYALAYHKRGTAKSALGDRKGAIEDLRRATKLYFDQGDFASYRMAKDLSNEVHELSSHSKDKASDKLMVGSLFS